MSIYYRVEYNIPSKHHFDQIRLRQNFTHGCAHWFWQRFPSNQKIDRPVSLFQENTLVLFEKSDWKMTILLFLCWKTHALSICTSSTDKWFVPTILGWLFYQDLIWDSDWPKQHCVACHPELLNCFLPSMPPSATKSGKGLKLMTRGLSSNWKPALRMWRWLIECSRKAMQCCHAGIKAEQMPIRNYSCLQACIE